MSPTEAAEAATDYLNAVDRLQGVVRDLRGVNPDLTVALLLTAGGEPCSVYATAAEADAQRDKYNADPFIEPGNPDRDAPYTVATWHVQATSYARVPALVDEAKQCLQIIISNAVAIDRGSF